MDYANRQHPTPRNLCRRTAAAQLALLALFTFTNVGRAQDQAGSGSPIPVIMKTNDQPLTRPEILFSPRPTNTPGLSKENTAQPAPPPTPNSNQAPPAKLTVVEDQAASHTEVLFSETPVSPPVAAAPLPTPAPIAAVQDEGTSAPAHEFASIRKGPSKNKLVSNVYFDTSIREALSDIASQAGETIVPDTTVQGIVSCELKDATIEQALNVVLATGEFAWRRMDGFILVGGTGIDSPSFAKLSETRSLKLNYLKADEAVKMVVEPLRKFVFPGPTTNVVAINGPPKLVQRIEEDIQVLDRPPQQIMLEARIVVMETNDALNQGLQWTWPQASFGTGTWSFNHGAESIGKAKWPYGLQLGIAPNGDFTNALLLTLNLLMLNDEATVTANPQIMAQEGKEASIQVRNEEYFEILTRGFYTNSELEKIESGTNVRVIPKISDNNEITMDINTEVSDVVSRGSNNLPVVTRRITTNSVRIEDGGTAAIAGLLDNRTRNNLDRVPFLHRLPLLGYLFRNEANQSSTRQVTLLITAHIVPTKQPEPIKAVYKKRVFKPVGKEFREELKAALAQLDKSPEPAEENVKPETSPVAVKIKETSSKGGIKQ